MSATPRISVVTPFYNTAKYLRECIESVLAQTRGDFEYILADNCSNDGSADIAREYASRDARIRYLRFEQLVPQVPNYNRALEQISPVSEFCKIVQADDWIFPTCLAEMVAVAERHPTAGLISAYEMLGDTVYQTGLQYPEEFVPGRELCRRSFLEDLFVFGSPNTVMYRSQDVRAARPFFKLDSPTEDVDAGFEILLRADFAFVHQVLTGTRRDNVSIWSGVARFNPVPLHRLTTLLRFGGRALSPEDYSTALALAESRHGKSLGRGLLSMRGKEFWQFHREGLASVGRKLRPLSIAGYALQLAARLALSPWDTTRAIVARLKGKPHR